MIQSCKPRVVVLAPGCDGQDVGESWSCFQWVAGLAKHCRLTLLTLSRVHPTDLRLSLPQVEVVQWPDWRLAKRFERFSSMAKPGYLSFYRHARRWLIDALKHGREFDLVHQLGPLAMRYPCPASGLDIPVIIGPVAGSLETPIEFRHECARAPWYTRLRKVDQLRFSYDPWLRDSYASADLVIGVAPYVQELLHSIPVRRFEFLSETGIHDLPGQVAARPRRAGELKLLFAGRVVRTKGLRDVIRAMAQLADCPDISLDVAGTGEDLAICRQEARDLGVDQRIRFLGKISRAELELHYARSDAFVFPSFREPSGNVVLEAMRHGLPVITCDRGGPSEMVDEASGFRLRAENPHQLACDLATTIRTLADDSSRLQRLSHGARQRVNLVARWDQKIMRMMQLYDSVLTHSHVKETT